jgi:starch phosphorylase
MEKWPVDMFGKLLPRHLELLYMINHIFLEKVKKSFPVSEHIERISRMSLIEET